MTIIFLMACVTLLPFSVYSVKAAGQGTPDHGHGARRAAGLLDPDDDRRLAVGHRHCRHGPHDPGQRDRHVGPGGRSGRRRGRAAAGQDRHDHAGQSAGGRVDRRRRGSRCGRWPTPPSLPRWPTKRRKAAASSCWPRSAMACAAATSMSLGATFMPFSAPDAHQRRQLERRAIRKGAADAIETFRPAARRRDAAGACGASVEDIAKQGGTPLVVADGSRRSASFISRTSSRGGSRSASPSCGGWGSRR